MKQFGVIGFSLVFWLAACGGDDPAVSGPKFTAASGTLTKAAATENLAQMQNGAMLGFQQPNGNPGVRDDFYASCTTKDPVTGVDNDSDAIMTQTRTYACTGITADRNTYSQNGTATTIDKDDNDFKGGFRYEYDVTGGHDQEDWTYNGFWDLAKDATKYLYTSDYKFTNVQKARAGAFFIGGGTFSHLVTPVDMEQPYTGGGAILFDGYYAYTFTIDSTVTNFVFKMSSENLTYGATPCTNFFDGGSYTYTDGVGNLIKVTHTNCSTRTATWNGEAI